MSTKRFSVGLDLGQAHDYTALAVVEGQDMPTGEWATSRSRAFTATANGLTALMTKTEVTQREYHLRHLDRFALGTSYPDAVMKVAGILATPPLDDDALLTVDATGVGRPVVDLLRRAHLKANVTAITITGGDQVIRDGWSIKVPKRDLVGGVQVLLQSGRLKWPKRMPFAQAFVDELLAFRVKISDTAHDSYGAWRDGEHDDLVLAVALAVWRAEHPPKPFKVW